MERATHYRPRVSRETRLLVTTALLAVLALWMLARLRFPAATVEPRALSQLLTQVGQGNDFDALAAQVSRVRGLVGAYLLPVVVDAPGGNSSVSPRAAFRIGGDLAVVYVAEGEGLRPSSDLTPVAFDASSRLAVIRLPIDPALSSAVPRVAPPPDSPRYLLATAVFGEGIALRPVFLAALTEVDVPLWGTAAWRIPDEPGLAPGSFLFTRDGDFAGLTTTDGAGMVLVSADTVLDEANRLISRPAGSAGDYRLDVEPLTPALQRALGISTGVAVSWVDPEGPADGTLAPGDVIESAGGSAVSTAEHWRRHAAGVVAGLPVALSVRRDGAPLTVEVTPVPAGAGVDQAAASAMRFGAATRPARGEGVEVTSVEPGQLAWRAGLRAGDIVTSSGGRPTPTPNQLAGQVGALQEGESLIVGVRRGTARRLLVIER